MPFGKAHVAYLPPGTEQSWALNGGNICQRPIFPATQVADAMMDYLGITGGRAYVHDHARSQKPGSKT